MKRIAICFLMFLTMVCAVAQQPQTQTAPIFPVNAKYSNGVAPGYAPCGSAAVSCLSTTGLNLNIGPGTTNCGGTILHYTGGSFLLTASTTNYVYLNTASSCAVAVKTTGFVVSDIPIATVVTSLSTITSIDDDRTPFFIPGSGASITALTGDGTATGPGSSVFTLATVNGSPATCGDATHTCQLTINGKGLTTSSSSIATFDPANPGPIGGTTPGFGTFTGEVINNFAAPFEPGGFITWIGSSFNQLQIHAVSTTSTPGSVLISGETSAFATTPLAQFVSTGNISYVPLSANLGLTIPGSASFAANLFAAGYSPGVTLFYSGSNTTTPGDFIFNGQTSAQANTQLFVMSSVENESFIQFLAQAGLVVAGAPSNVANSMTFTSGLGASTINSVSNSGTAGNVIINGETSSFAITPLFNFNPAGNSTAITTTFSAGLSSSNLKDTGVTASQKALALDGSQNVIAATVAGSGAGLTTGPTSSTVTGDVTTFTGTGGQIQDSGVLLSGLAPLANPAFTAIPTAPTATTGTNTTQLATTAFVLANSTAIRSPFPFNIRLTVDGTSEEIGFNRQQEVVVTSGAGPSGSGYTCSGGCTNNTQAATITGLTCVNQPTGQWTLDPNGSGGIISLTYFGQQCTAGTGAVTATGFTAGSGATATLGLTGNPNYTKPWPNILSTLSAFSGHIAQNCGGGSSPCYTNFAVTSETVAGAISNYTSNGYAAICSSASYNEFFILSGVLIQNSINTVVGNIPLLTAEGQWTGLVHRLKADGCKVIVTTPFNVLNGSANDNLGNVKAAQFIRNGIPGVDYDYLIDFGAMFQSNSDPTILAFDNTHQTASGHQIFAYNANSALLDGGTYVMGPGMLGPFPNLNVLGTTTTKLLGLTDSGSTTPTLVNQFEAQYYSANPGITTLTTGSSGATKGTLNIIGCDSTITCTQSATFSPTGSGITGTLLVSGALTTSNGITNNVTGIVNGGFSANVSGKSVWSVNGNNTFLYGGSATSTQGGFVIGGVNTSLVAISYQTMQTTGDTFGIPVFLTGVSTAPTAAVGTNTTQIATTSFVQAALPLVGTTGSIGGGALLANACTSGTATVTGLTTAMTLEATPVADPNSPGTTQSYDWYAVRTGTNTATVFVCAILAGTPSATTYNVRAIQ